MDAGRVFAQDIIEIEPVDNYSSMCVKTQELALEMANKYLPLYFENKLVGKAQDESQITFCPSIKKEEEHLNLLLSPIDFTNFVRSLADVPGGFVFYKDSILKIFETKVYDETTEFPIGKVIVAKKKLIVIQVEGGTVSVLRIQKPGKKIMSASDFNNGVHDFEGEILK